MKMNKNRFQENVEPKDSQAALIPEDDIDFFVNMMHEKKRLDYQEMMDDPMLFASMVNKNAERRRMREMLQETSGSIHSIPITVNYAGNRIAGYAERMVVLGGDAEETLIHVRKVTNNGR